LKRKKDVIIQVFLLALAAFVTLNSSTTRSIVSEDMGFYIKSAVTFSNDGNATWNLTREDQSWSCFMNNSWQTVCLIDHAHPLKTVEKGVDGNEVAFFLYGSSLQPGENVSDYAVYHVRSKPRSIPNLNYAASGDLTDIPQDLQEKYCNGHGFWMTNETQIRARAFAIAGTETRVLAVVTKLVSWIWRNIVYKSHDPPLYPNETLALREGDCDEQAILLGTFCRILGIPSRLQMGCIFTFGHEFSSDEGQVHYVEKQIGWHGWAIVYIPPWGWLPVDLTYILGSPADPLNAIRTAAVTSQYTIQSMNISENDYLASDRAYMELLERNNLSLYIEHEMQETNPLLGDLDGDKIVDITDIVIAAQAFGSKPIDGNWNAIADINRDEYVNIADIRIIAKQYGKTE
jgi:hypothetical protein